MTLNIRKSCMCTAVEETDIEGLILFCETKRNETKRNETKSGKIEQN